MGAMEDGRLHVTQYISLNIQIYRHSMVKKAFTAASGEGVHFCFTVDSTSFFYTEELAVLILPSVFLFMF